MAHWGWNFLCGDLQGPLRVVDARSVGIDTVYSVADMAYKEWCRCSVSCVAGKTRMPWGSCARVVKSIFRGSIVLDPAASKPYGLWGPVWPAPDHVSLPNDSIVFGIGVVLNRGRQTYRGIAGVSDLEAEALNPRARISDKRGLGMPYSLSRSRDQ
jgi:hypothetical protein